MSNRDMSVDASLKGSTSNRAAADTSFAKQQYRGSERCQEEFQQSCFKKGIPLCQKNKCILIFFFFPPPSKLG